MQYFRDKNARTNIYSINKIGLRILIIYKILKKIKIIWTDCEKNHE